MVLSVDMGQGPDWTAMTPLIQAKQREIADRMQADAVQAREAAQAPQAIASANGSGETRLDMGQQQARDLAGYQTRDQARDQAEDQGYASSKDLGQAERAQIALQAHILFKAQGGDETGVKREVEKTANAPAASGGKTGASDLTAEEQRVVKELQARDAEVRRHEQAHAAVGGSYASAPSYTYQVGPDGRRYAVGGSVQIDMSPVPNDPEATIAKMDVVRRAAMAPAETSAADRSVAAAAQAAQAQAMADLQAQKVEKFGSSLDIRA